jgi:hypothetical protein
MSAAIWLLGSHLGISTHTAPEQLGYVLAYFSGFSGPLLLFLGEFLRVKSFSALRIEFIADILFPRLCDIA